MVSWLVHGLAEPFIKQLMETILSRPVKIKALRVDLYNEDYRAIIDPDNLKKIFNKMTFLYLEGYFTSAQEEAARSLAGVHVETELV